jgi:hypothetical protein
MFYESGIGWSLGTILSSVLETLNISKYQDFDVLQILLLLLLMVLEFIQKTWKNAS